MAHRYGTFTAARRAALRKAQLASAAKRRGKGKGRSSKGRRYAKRTAKTVGVIGAIGVASYAVHRGNGNRFIVSGPHTPNPYQMQTKVKLRRTSGGSISYTHLHLRGKRAGKETIALYARNVAGSKIKGRPGAKDYKPRVSMVNPYTFRKNNYPHTTEAKRIASRKFRHSGNAYTRRISEAEALRRTQSYVGAREYGGKGIRVSERDKAFAKYRKQTR